MATGAPPPCRIVSGGSTSGAISITAITASSVIVSHDESDRVLTEPKRFSTFIHKSVRLVSLALIQASRHSVTSIAELRSTCVVTRDLSNGLNSC